MARRPKTDIDYSWDAWAEKHKADERFLMRAIYPPRSQTCGSWTHVPLSNLEWFKEYSERWKGWKTEIMQVAE